MSGPRRILLLSEGFGTGHTQAAHALAEGFRMLHDSVEPHVIELSSCLHPRFAPWVFEMYRRTLAVRPELYGRLYRSNKQSELSASTKWLLHRAFYQGTERLLREYAPDAIVCTHPFPALVVARLKSLHHKNSQSHATDSAEGVLKKAGSASGSMKGWSCPSSLPLAGVVTDYDAHASWVDEGITKYFVSTVDVKNRFTEKGIHPHRIQVTGIPVHPRFWTRHNREAVRARLGLSSLPTVLIMGGGWGLIEDGEMVDALLQWRDQIQLLFCFGSNQDALQRSAEDERFQHPNVRLVGFSQEIDLLMEASDLLVTKPGGLTCTEAMTKGLPMLFYRPIPGQEEENCLHFTKSGFGERMNHVEELHTRLERLAAQPGEEAAKRQLRREAALAASGGRTTAEAILQLFGWQIPQALTR